MNIFSFHKNDLEIVRESVWIANLKHKSIQVEVIFFEVRES